MYHTEIKRRRDVLPRSSIIYRGNIWTASANTDNYLYLYRLCTKTRTNADSITVLIENTRYGRQDNEISP